MMRSLTGMKENDEHTVYLQQDPYYKDAVLKRERTDDDPPVQLRIEYPAEKESLPVSGKAWGRRVDLPMTGSLLRLRLRRAGISVRDVQKAAGLECPQSIYRWFDGQALPSVENLYVLHRLLGCSMENLLVTRDRPMKLRCAAYLNLYFKRALR